MFTAVKVFNNNVVLVRGSEDETEQVVIGSGIGFGVKAGQQVDSSRIERVYVLDAAASRSQLESFLAEMPYETVIAVSKAIQVAEESLGRKLGRSLPVALLDHVSFALERAQRGLVLPPVVMPELTVMFPDEWAAAKAMHSSLVRSLGVELPPDDALYLAMHILNATRDEYDQNAGVLFRRTQHIVDLTEKFLGIVFDESSLDYARYVLHVKFFLQRVAMAKQLRKNDGVFFEFARENYPRAYQCAKQIATYVVTETDTQPTDEEMLYLIVHIERLAQVPATKPGS